MADVIPDYSSYGPKRVKTREMEIEAHDPEKLQRIVERANNTNLPTFCGGGTCVGRHKCESRTNYAE